MSTRKYLAGLLGAATLAAFSVQPAAADTFRFALGFPSGAPIEAGKKYAEAVKEYTNNRHRVRLFELSLLNHSEMSEGINKGLADIGYLLTAYSPSDYPFSNMGADLSMVTALSNNIEGQEGYAYSGAMLEYIMLNCEECQEEFNKNNQVYTSVVSTPAYVMFCNDPIDSLASVKGKRLRISGAPWARWARAFEAQPVALPVGEIYEALSQGVVDCTFLSPTELTNFNLIEVVRNITTDVPGGLYAAGGSSTLNKTKWDAFSGEDKEAFLKAGAVMAAQITYLYQEQATADLEKARARGINIIQSQPDMLEKSREFIKKDLEYVPQFYADEYKLDVNRLKELSATMLGLIEKWEGIIAKADIKSADDLRDVYWEEVYSKIDPSQYSPKK
ncbi:MAG: TRAP transporter substrate-binding protein DctP [Alcaligenaceae bacterium]|nr:TRAP transporter substrate-binding protein DctP [Alcaligenaceae bacterium]